MHKINKARLAMVAGGGSIVAAIVAVASLAGATSYNPTSNLTTLANSVGSEAGPIVIAVASAFVGLIILFWGVGWVLGWFRARKSHF